MSTQSRSAHSSAFVHPASISSSYQRISVATTNFQIRSAGTAQRQYQSVASADRLQNQSFASADRLQNQSFASADRLQNQSVASADHQNQFVGLESENLLQSHDQPVGTARHENQPVASKSENLLLSESVSVNRRKNKSVDTAQRQIQSVDFENPLLEESIGQHESKSGQAPAPMQFPGQPESETQTNGQPPFMLCFLVSVIAIFLCKFYV